MAPVETSDDMKNKIRDIVHQVTNIAPDQIGDTTSFSDELDIDSLSMMEIGVDIDFAYQLGLPDEAFTEIDCLNDAVALVERELAAKTPELAVAQSA